ncbi:MAG TPA: putative toxin-antitoxin system toxin component, PIN family [Chloroflexota bacterium]
MWVSALLNPSGGPAQVLRHLAEQRYTLLMSEPLLDELAAVLARPRLVRKYGISQADILELRAMLQAQSEEVKVRGDLKICRDPDDDIVIETALLGSADALVTRDDDLKGSSDVVAALTEVGVAVLSVRQFLAAL